MFYGQIRYDFFRFCPAMYCARPEKDLIGLSKLQNDLQLFIPVAFFLLCYAQSQINIATKKPTFPRSHWSAIRRSCRRCDTIENTNCLSSSITSLIIIFNHLHPSPLYSSLLCLPRIARLKRVEGGWRGKTILCSARAWSSREELVWGTLCPRAKKTKLRGLRRHWWYYLFLSW